jgi:hypothetical protein
MDYSYNTIYFVKDKIGTGSVVLDLIEVLKRDSGIK